VELAAAANVTQSVVSAYERGRREPSLETLRRLVGATGGDLRVDVVFPTARITVVRPLRPWLEKLAPDIKDAAQRHGYNNVRLFGSVARGDDGPDSDVDLLVDGHRGLIDLAGLTDDLESLLGVPVDVVPSHTLKPDVAKAALAEAVPL
jgi:predicted nucleotidyltransferase